MKNPRVRPFLLAVLLIFTVTAAACGSKDPLSISCGDYVKKDTGTQLELAALWGAPDRHTVDALARAVAPKYADDLRSYCPTHKSARLMDLELRLF